MVLSKKFWGNATWATIHYLALTNNKIAYIKFIESLQYILPCKECRGHLQTNLRQFPINKQQLFYWSFTLHNHVNRQLNKIVLTNFMATEQYYRSTIRNLKTNFWNCFHSIIATYNPTTMKLPFLEFINSLRELLPYYIGFDDMVSRIKLTDTIMNSRDSLILWGYNIHNNIERLVDYQTFKTFYTPTLT
jgi:hypothetical protein